MKLLKQDLSTQRICGNSYIKNMFSQYFLLHSIMVKGEVSNCKYHSSGHIYFTLKDENGKGYTIYDRPDVKCGDIIEF